MQYSINEVYLLDIEYQVDSIHIILNISVNGVSRDFVALPDILNNIKLMSSSDELSDLLMSLIPYEPSIYKKLYSIVWDYIECKPVNLPVKLI